MVNGLNVALRVTGTDSLSNAIKKTISSVSSTAASKTQQSSTSTGNSGSGLVAGIKNTLKQGTGKDAKATKQMGSKMMGGLKGIMSSLAPLLGIAAGLAAIIQSSKSLQRMLSSIGKILMMFLRPIGDILATLLMPLLSFLRPMALFINSLMRPYIVEARKNFRTGMRFQAQARQASGLGLDDSAKQLNALAMESFGIGAMQLGTGLMELFTVAIGEGLKLAVDVVFAPIELLLTAFQGLGNIMLNLIPMSGGLKEAWNNMFTGENGIITNVEKMKDGLKDMIDNGIKTAREGLQNFSSSLSERGDELDDMATDVGSALAELGKVRISDEDIEGFDTSLASALSSGSLKAVEKFKIEFDKQMALLNEKEDESSKKPLSQSIDYSKYFKEGAFDRAHDIGNEGREKNKEKTFNFWENLTTIFSSSTEGISTLIGKWWEDQQKMWNKDMENIQKNNKNILGIVEGDFAAFGKGLQGVASRALAALSSTQRSMKQAASIVRAAREAANEIREESKGRGAAGMTFVPQNGMYYLHRGEQVVPTGGTSNNTKNDVNINLHIANINASGNVEEIKTQLDSLIEENMRKYR